jgi:hypothetical protein
MSSLVRSAELTLPAQGPLAPSGVGLEAECAAGRFFLELGEGPFPGLVEAIFLSRDSITRRVISSSRWDLRPALSRSFTFASRTAICRTGLVSSPSALAKGPSARSMADSARVSSW